MKKVRTRTLLDATERAKRIRDIRLRLAPEAGGYVSQGAFGKLVAAEIGKEDPYSASTASRWEEGAEPGLAAGIGIAALGGVPVESLAFLEDAAAPAQATTHDGNPLPQAAQEVLNKYPPNPRQTPAVAPRHKRKA